jgi:NinG protein
VIALPKPIAPEKAPPKPIARGRGLNRKRKTTLAQLKRQLWGLFALYVKERDGDTCITCGKAGLIGQSRQAGHWIRKDRHASVAYDPKNVHVQCNGCNGPGGRGMPHAYAAEIIRRYGQAEFDRLVNRARVTHEFKRWEIEELIAALRKGGAEYEMLYYSRYL